MLREAKDIDEERNPVLRFFGKLVLAVAMFGSGYVIGNQSPPINFGTLFSEAMPSGQSISNARRISNPVTAVPQEPPVKFRLTSTPGPCASDRENIFFFDGGQCLKLVNIGNSAHINSVTINGRKGDEHCDVPVGKSLQLGDTWEKQFLTCGELVEVDVATTKGIASFRLKSN
jgi:hypothetical protein